MNSNEKQNNIIDTILKDTHSKVEPSDSWQELRTRIDSRIDGTKLSSIPTTKITQNILFWRRLAFGMAACFLITAVALVYLLSANYGMQEQRAAANNLLNRVEMSRLTATFSQVRQLFGQQSRWIMVGSGNSTQMGVANNIGSREGNHNVIVVRLAVNHDNEGPRRQYFDVVTFSEQQVDFQLPLADTSVINISLTPILTIEGKIVVDINAQLNDGSVAKGIITVAENSFSSLVRMRANGNWVSIDVTGQSVSNI